MALSAIKIVTSTTLSQISSPALVATRLSTTALASKNALNSRLSDSSRKDLLVVPLDPSRTTVSTRGIHVPKWRWGRPKPKPNRGEKYGRNWRERQGLPNQLDETGPLAELPDWSYADDGRPGPLSKKQTVKILEQQRLARDVLSGLEFVKFIQNRPERLQAEAEAQKSDIAETKLKQKGHKIARDSK